MSFLFGKKWKIEQREKEVKKEGKWEWKRKWKGCAVYVTLPSRELSNNSENQSGQIQKKVTGNFELYGEKMTKEIFNLNGTWAETSGLPYQWL